jgi:hypothetical protein
MAGLVYLSSMGGRSAIIESFIYQLGEGVPSFLDSISSTMRALAGGQLGRIDEPDFEFEAGGKKVDENG